MAPAVDEDWSDSDEDVGSEMETSVLLGVPDGPIMSDAELADAAVSRIGGLPAFLPANEPPISSSQCKNCSFPMELLVQLWCPFENSPMDRALYVWGCANPGCQRKDGSIRAWRGLRFNEKYAEKLALKRQQEQAKQTKQASKINPFSMKSSSPAANNPFGLGTQVFGTPSPPDDDDNAQDEEDISDTSSTSSEESLLTAMTKTTLSDSHWTAAPSYSPLYLSTASEYLPPQPKPKIPSGVQVSEDAGDKEGGKDISWAFEPYENSLEIDHVFERFTKRVGYEGEQCIRYELNGTPLPFSSDKIFESLFPSPSSNDTLKSVTKPDIGSKVTPLPKRVYAPTTSALPPCPACKGKRIFECQLMPNLINILRAQSDAKEEKMSDEERRALVQKALKGGGTEKGMEWGTCLIFSCEKDCRVNSDENTTEAKNVWKEEVALVQWDV